MWRFEFGFLVVTIVIGLFGFRDASGGATPIARVGFMFFAALWLLSLVSGWALGRARLTHRHGHP